MVRDKETFANDARRVEVNKLNVAELKTELARRKLSTTGKKARASTLLGSCHGRRRQRQQLRCQERGKNCRD